MSSEQGERCRSSITRRASPRNAWRTVNGVQRNVTYGANEHFTIPLFHYSHLYGFTQGSPKPANSPAKGVSLYLSSRSFASRVISLVTGLFA